MGCDKISYAVPMTEEVFKIIASDPNTGNYFFVLVTNNSIDDLAKLLSM